MSFKIALLTLLLVVVGVARALPWIAEPRLGVEYWVHRHETLLNRTRDHAPDIRVIFLGDSITEGWETNGKDVWAEHYAPRGAFNYGIGGDKTEHILWRLAHEFDKVTPGLVVLKIGTNNIGSDAPGEIGTGVWAILEALRVKFPAARVLLLSVLPRSDVPYDSAVHQLNDQIGKYADNKRIFYLDLTGHFETGLAREIRELYIADGVHLTAKGYEVWYQTMEPTFAKLIV